MLMSGPIWLVKSTTLHITLYNLRPKMFRVVAVVGTFGLIVVVAAIRQCYRFILSLIESFPAQIANPTFIAFAITLVSLAVYVVAKYRFKRISRTDQRAIKVVCIEVVLVPIILNALWCGHLNRTVVVEAYNQDQRLHQPLQILFAIELPVYAAIAFCLINWCEANSQRSLVEVILSQASQKSKTNPKKFHRGLNSRCLPDPIQEYMLEEIWQKDVPITFQLFEDDVASQVLPLPLVLEARFNHYLGFYFQAVQQFFFRYALQPNIKEQFWLEYSTPQGATIELKPTDLMVILYMRYFRFSDESPIIRVHYRKDVEGASVDLAVFYRQSLKASTVLKNRKQGIAAIVSVFSNSQINALVESLKQSDFKHFYGAEPNQEQEQPGFRVLMKQHDSVPLRIYSKCQRLERAYDPNSSILDVKKSLNIDASVPASVWGVPIANPICLRELLELCHADGFMYLYVDV